MRIIINSELLEGLTYRGVLALVAAAVLGDGQWTTSQLAQTVSCNSSLMLEGLGELHTKNPEFVSKAGKGKWMVGTGKCEDDRVQILDCEAAKRTELLDDLKKYWDWGNPGVPFSMNAADGRAVGKFLKDHKDWDQTLWRTALRNRCMSEVNHAQPLFAWVGRLGEYSATPLDRYGKPMLNGGGKHGQAVGTELSNRQAREIAVAATSN